MMIARDTLGRKVSGRSVPETGKKFYGGQHAEGTIGRKTSSISSNDRHVYPESRKQTGKPEFTNVINRAQVAFDDQAERKEIKDLGQKGRHEIMAAALSNPISRVIKDPQKELREEMKQIKNAAGTIVKAVTGDEVDFTEPQDTPEKQKIKQVKKGLDYIDEGMRKGFDRLKKKLKRLFNHPEWYTKYSDYVTSNLNWGVRKEAQYFRVASGASFNVFLTIPQKDGVVSRAYIDAITANFTKLRGSNSGAFNYAVQDVAAYTEVTRGIRAIHAKLVRDIKCLNNVDPYVSQSPEPLLKLCGYSTTEINDMRLNRANYVAELNRLADFIDATFPSQPDMTVFERDKYLATAILEDGKGPKSSLYVTRIAAVMVPNGTPGELTGHELAVGTFSARLNDLENLISAARAYVSATYPNVDTFAKISGDIFKAYGQAGLKLRCDKIDLNDKATTAFDDYLLHQLQNNTAIIMTDPFDTNGVFDSGQPFAMKYGVTIEVWNAQATARTIPSNAVLGVRSTNTSLTPIPVNTHKRDVSGGEAISLTRNITTFFVDRDTITCDNVTYDFDAHIDNCDTTVIYGPQIQYYRASNPNDMYYMQLNSHILYHNNGYFGDLWAQCDYLPYYQVFADDNTGNYHLVVDLDMYAYMAIDQIKQFNDSAVASMYKTIDVSDQVNFRAIKR